MKIKLCPFCGNIATIGSATDTGSGIPITTYQYTCPGEGCPIRFAGEWYPTKKLALTAWNTRKGKTK